MNHSGSPQAVRPLTSGAERSQRNWRPPMHRLVGATVARLTPDQKVGSSNLSRVIIAPGCLLCRFRCFALPMMHCGVLQVHAVLLLLQDRSGGPRSREALHSDCLTSGVRRLVVSSPSGSLLPCSKRGCPRSTCRYDRGRNCGLSLSTCAAMAGPTYENQRPAASWNVSSMPRLNARRIEAAPQA